MSGATLINEKYYHNAGNAPLLSLLPVAPGLRVLDCGCGAGDNARILRDSGASVTAITASAEEEQAASKYCEKVMLADLNEGIPAEALSGYDVVMFSHVLEHLFDPAKALHDAAQILKKDGVLAVALPNALTWRTRLQFLLGRFEYADGGIMDDTHVRFYTFDSGQRMLQRNGFNVVVARADGIFPLSKCRKMVSAGAQGAVDRWACERFPGLFGFQSLYLATPANGRAMPQNQR
jgi:SAM-dependent methyltransferase